MKTLNKSATRIFLNLIAGLEPGRAKKIDNAPGAYMAVHVDCLSRSGDEGIYAIAHRYEQRGDQVPDPDVEFYVTPLGVAPTAIDQSFGYRRWIDFDEAGQPKVRHASSQADLTSFCNTWLRSIREQQGL
jgi:hypothetical protein